MSDPVNKPSHYNAGEVETIDGIRAALGEGFADYCRGNVLKYVWRCGLKGDAVEDLRKAATYLKWAIEAIDGNCPVIPDSSSRKPIPIPDGYSELAADDFIVFGDLYDDGDRWLGYTYDPGSDINFKYDKGRHVRHVRKIEPDEPGPLAIPAGWRELEPEEFPKVTDMYENEGAWRNRINDSSFLYALYEVRHIRKIETSNLSEALNSSTWIPRVGDKVRVKCATPFPKEDRFGIVVKDNVRPREDLFLVKTSNGIFSWFYTSELELIEAAK